VEERRLGRFRSSLATLSSWNPLAALLTEGDDGAADEPVPSLPQLPALAAAAAIQERLFKRRQSRADEEGIGTDSPKNARTVGSWPSLAEEEPQKTPRAAMFSGLGALLEDGDDHMPLRRSHPGAPFMVARPHLDEYDEVTVEPKPSASCSWS